MGRPIDARHGAPLAATLIVSLAASMGLRAQQTAAPPPKPIVPVAASSVLSNPDAYYGQTVTLTVAVDQIFSRSAFSVAQRTVSGAPKALGKDVLVIAPTLNGTVEANAYVTILGELVRFEPAEVARKTKDYTLDLAPDIVAKYAGRPAVLATAVINGAMVDLAKRLPPPMTAEEAAFSNTMKRVGPAFASLRTATAASTADAATQNAAVLKQAFTETETFWKTRGKTEPMQWAHEARAQAESIERDVSAGKWDAVRASAATLGQACQTCHAAYRERLDDGSFRIKTGR